MQWGQVAARLVSHRVVDLVVVLVGRDLVAVGRDVVAAAVAAVSNQTVYNLMGLARFRMRMHAGIAKTVPAKTSSLSRGSTAIDN